MPGGEEENANLKRAGVFKVGGGLEVDQVQPPPVGIPPAKGIGQGGGVVTNAPVPPALVA